MLGGAVGVGVAYPLDTIKTKLQARETTTDGSVSNALVLAREIVRDEGFDGFYSGVTSTMAGQALVKGVVFFVYEWAKDAAAMTPLGSGLLALTVAACISGAAGSFVVTPVERIKCVMQAAPAGTYANPLACAYDVLRADGGHGLAFRGLGATLLRETPAYGFYFVTFEIVNAALLADGNVPTSLTPLIGGAFAGAMAWLPVYPIDVVKTRIQVLGAASVDHSVVGTAQQIWETGGPWAFWDGIGPKLSRAVLNHAVTFYVYDLTCSHLLPIWVQ